MTAARNLERPGRGVAGRLDLYAYLAEDGFPAYRWHNGEPGTVRGTSRRVSAGPSARSGRARLARLDAEKVYARTGPASAFWWLTWERDADIAYRSLWMLRVVDAPAAIAARGSPRDLAQRPLDSTTSVPPTQAAGS